MDPFSAAAMVGTAATVIKGIVYQVNELVELYKAIKEADVRLMSLIAQLNTMKAALEQIQTLMEKADYSQQLQMDLSLALQASQLHIGVMDKKIAKMKVKKGASTLKLKSKIKVVFDSKTMDECVTRLDHQAGALTLLISVLTSKTLTEQKSLLQRSNTRKVFKQLQDDTSSIQLLREDDEVDRAPMKLLEYHESERPALPRSQSEQVIAKSPWKRFSFDRQLFMRRKPKGGEKEAIEEVVEAVPTESDQNGEDITTLVEEPEGVGDKFSFEESLNPNSKLKSASTPLPDLTHDGQLHFSRMLAFGHEDTNIPDLIAKARKVWEANSKSLDHDELSSSARLKDATVYPLKTRYFDMSIHYQAIHANRRIEDDMLARFKDVSSILFAVNLANYCQGEEGSSWLASDMQLFDRLANNYHLWLAKIILFLDTSGLNEALAELPSIHPAIEDIRLRFTQAGGMGASMDRLHVQVGEPDESAAGAIFAITNHASQRQSNKWGGLSRYATS